MFQHKTQCGKRQVTVVTRELVVPLSLNADDDTQISSQDQRDIIKWFFVSKLWIALGIIGITIIIISLTLLVMKDQINTNAIQLQSSCTKIYNPRPTCIENTCINKYESYIHSIFNESIKWNTYAMKNYLKSFHTTSLGKCITNLNISCELRPDPKCYLPSNAIDFHLKMFVKNGASSITSTKYAHKANFTMIGRPGNEYDINGVLWISPYQTQIDLLHNCLLKSNPKTCILSSLGISANKKDMFENNWGNPTRINRVMQVYVYKESLMALNLRMATGNEKGTNDLWRPGGYTINGMMEAVVDRVPTGQYCWDAVASPNGTFCYDNCPTICDNVQGCLRNNCKHVQQI